MISFRFFLNDVLVEENSLKKMIEAGEADKKIGVIAPIIFSYRNLESIKNTGYMINFWTGWMEKLRYGRGIFNDVEEKIVDVCAIKGC